jgi:hypothetical protein
MDIAEQKATFHLVMGLTKWGCLAFAALLIWFVLWFCTTAGFWSGLFAGIVVTAIGVTVLRDRGEAH